jgi:uncharacterized protein
MQGFRRVDSTVLRLLLAAVVGFSSTAVLAERVEDLPKPADYVSDYAHVLTPEAIARLDSLCSQLDHSQANAQIAIVTIHNLNGDDAADYANQLEDKWKMGRKGSDRGALVLLAVDDHKYRIDVGYGLEGILPDGKVGDIGREMVPYLRASDYDSAVTTAVDEMAQVIAADAKITLTDEPTPASQPVEQMHHSAVIGKLILFIFILIFFGGSSIFRLLLGYGLFSSIFGGRNWGGGGGGGFGGGGGGGGGFGGFGGGGFGGGGAGGSW